MSEKLILVPMPRQIEQRSGSFYFRDGGQIAIDDPQAAFQSARRLQAALRAETTLATEIVIGEIGEHGRIAVTLAVSPTAVERAQGYSLRVTPEHIHIVGHDAAGLFYGVCTLNQLIRQLGVEIPCLSIDDYPDFPVRGVMLDVSRGKVPTLETLIDLIDLLAGLKINQLQLYVEHTFAYREHPVVWADASPLTGQDILELDACCRERFIELAPNQNSLGHLVPWLTHPQYAHLAEAPDGFEWPWGGRSDGPFSLNPTDPRSFDLLRSMYDDLLPYFSSRMFNVGCDETFDIGVGRSKAACEAKGRYRVYLDFLLQVYQLVQERGRTMMFWGDIILHEPALIPELPKDAIALEWGYEFDHPFDKDCAEFAKAGVPFYVCPGTASWNSLAGRTDNAMGNLRNAAENGLKHGAIGYLITDWGDNGHWQYQPMSYPGYLYGAAVSWAYEANVDLDLPQALSRHAFGDPTGMMGRLAFDLGNVYRIYERFTGKRIHNTHFLVALLYAPLDQIRFRGVDWQDVPAEMFDQARRTIDAAMALLPEARMQGKDAALTRREYLNAARLLRHACDLGEFKIALARGEMAAAWADALADDMRAILHEHRQLWLARNRVGGLEQGSGRHFQGMIDAYRRIARNGA
ncbi:MAG: family 20 glycosylhydrolase [Anaerolineae bacterium]|nr:family 20 glycosylhydrolase [Anaerolineae bacterium]